jgi:hypothetical protein
MESTANQSQQTLTLAAGVAGALTFDTSGSKSLALVIENTGANAVGTTVATVSPDGTIYGTNSAIGTAIGSIAAGASALVEITDVAFQKIKLTFTSASGSTVRVTLRGT